jgi:hypothetical protein
MEALWVAFEEPQRSADIPRDLQVAREGVCGVPSERTGSLRGVPRVLPWAGMLRPVGAFNTQNAPSRCGLEGVNEVPICRCGEPLARGYNRNG